MKVLPTPTGPMIITLWPASTKRSEHSSSQTARSKLTLVVLVPVLEHHVGIEAGGPGPQGRRRGLAPGHLVGEHEFEKLGVAHCACLGQGQALGEGVEAAAEFHGTQNRLELGRDDRGRGAHDDAPAVVASGPDRGPPGLWVLTPNWENAKVGVGPGEARRDADAPGSAPARRDFRWRARACDR